jgi:hypothetical protein
MPPPSKLPIHHLANRPRGRELGGTVGRFWSTFLHGDFKWLASERYAGRLNNCGRSKSRRSTLFEATNPYSTSSS